MREIQDGEIFGCMKVRKSASRIVFLAFTRSHSLEVPYSWG